MGIKVNKDFDLFCDRVIFFSLCAAVFVLPVSIAMLDSFVGSAAFFYLLKKFNRLRHSLKMPFWKVMAPEGNFLGKPLAFLTLATFLSVAFSQYHQMSFVAFFGKFVKYVFVYFSFMEVCAKPERIRIFLGVFLLSALIVSLSGLEQHYTGRDFLRGRLTGMEGTMPSQRISSCFDGANAFGVYLLPLIALMAHLVQAAAQRRSVWAWPAAAFLVLLLVCLCWTYSRASWVGYLAVLLVMTLLDHRKILLAAGLLAVFIFVFIPSLNQVRHMGLVQDTTTTQDLQNFWKESGSGRSAFWKKAVSIIRSSPVFGTGINTYGRIIRQDPDTRNWWYAHNSYLQMAAETGMVGLGCFLWLLVVLLREGISACGRLEGWPLALLQGSVAGLSGILVQSFFDNTFYAVQLATLVWMVIGFLAVLTRLARR